MEIRDALSYRVVAVGLGAGLLFVVMDGLINANQLAQRLYALFRPVARESVNAPLGVILDFASGIVMAYLFMVLAPALPRGDANKGIAFGLLAWFFRVPMGLASQVVMFPIPVTAILYSLLTGMAEMVALGLFYAVLQKPR